MRSSVPSKTIDTIIETREKVLTWWSPKMGANMILYLNGLNSSFPCHKQQVRKKRTVAIIMY